MANLALVGGRDVDVKEKSPAELVFDYKILPSIQEVATGMNSRGGRFACKIGNLVTNDPKIAGDLEKLLMEKALVKVNLKPGMNLSGDLALRLVKAYSG